jgi:hypothetical protein
MQNTSYISKDNFIIVYVKDNIDSLEFAKYYANKHNMTVWEDDEKIVSDNETWETLGQLVGIKCSTNEILEDEDVFNEEVLFPLREFLDSDVSGGNFILGIGLGYRVPGGFKYYNDPSSSNEYV